MTAAFTSEKALILAWGALIEEGFSRSALKVQFRQPILPETPPAAHRSLSQRFGQLFRRGEARKAAPAAPPAPHPAPATDLRPPLRGGILIVDAGDRRAEAVAILLQHGAELTGDDLANPVAHAEVLEASLA